ncbi:hypothetical protein LTR09_011357 [Extremus antarcticus]|uniref:Ubiquitin-like domain-containing protein n=1 Tax=Extremus antarcticus TaxID=702011 RepID=A0AAJ0DCJ3_9PEZI|nr:hypothetical protein LTR09_011357 [Extremus antarcticus]
MSNDQAKIIALAKILTGETSSTVQPSRPAPANPPSPLTRFQQNSLDIPPIPTGEASNTEDEPTLEPRKDTFIAAVDSVTIEIPDMQSSKRLKVHVGKACKLEKITEWAAVHFGYPKNSRRMVNEWGWVAGDLYPSDYGMKDEDVLELQRWRNR